ncbi:hypothetical protein [Silvimonas sp.]|uniref:hypothetical protein n=1 Tax=Silvimonas sp. TaxID=2650811 RepID=UPI00284F4E01|nr:hypothetical protein [Silvimonas sp.]MDR3428991.1 hypothetical protein [Silvimonas sp.]
MAKHKSDLLVDIVAVGVLVLVFLIACWCVAVVLATAISYLVLTQPTIQFSTSQLLGALLCIALAIWGAWRLVRSRNKEPQND